MKQFLLASISLLTSIVGFSQKPTEKTLLWKIEGKNIVTPSYLYGTFHILCPTDYFMHDTIKNMVAQTQQMFLEIDIDDPALTSKMMKNIAMKNGTTIKDLLSEKEYDSVAKLFKEKPIFQ
jgi:uncharacterized protein YbaP (TraB family)